MPNSPVFQCRQVYDKPPFIKRKYMNVTNFVNEWPKLSDIHVNAHIFRSDTRQAFVLTFTLNRFSHDESHHRVYERVQCINAKDSISIGQLSVESSI